ncbi:MAG: hypothetical protein QHJ82_05620 [Verrucomicrobiota bacterium]|nr:hypothetical protein [Verrucomicrobiota bacterium]
MNFVPFELFGERMRDFISRSAGSFHPHHEPERDADSEFNALAIELFKLQYDSVSPYRTWCESQGVKPSSVSHWSQIPAIPTAAFKDLELTCLPIEQRHAVFHSSGTTRHRPSRHWHNSMSLGLYEASLLAWFQPHLLPEHGREKSCSLRWLALTPPPNLAPRSSLVHMLGTVISRFGPGKAVFAGRPAADNAWLLDIDSACAMLDEAEVENAPVCILTTAFHCVELASNLAERNKRIRLPLGSRLMETGGYKGRSREISKRELHDMVWDRLGITAEYSVSEYGMTELSSQAYDWVAGKIRRSSSGVSHETARCFRFPPWARIQVISPETSRPVSHGETGFLRIFDLANVCSVMAVQTDDLVILRNHGFDFLGRKAGSEPRGCSLMAK